MRPKHVPANVQAIGDFNHDGKLDFATQSDSNPLTVYLGNGDGTFGAPKVVDPNSFVQSILAVDLNHDNKTDLVVLTGGFNNGDLFSVLQIWISNGDGTFTKGQTINTSVGPVRTGASILRTHRRLRWRRQARYRVDLWFGQ